MDQSKPYAGAHDIGDGGIKQVFKMSCGPTVLQIHIANENPLLSKSYRDDCESGEKETAFEKEQKGLLHFAYFDVKKKIATTHKKLVYFTEFEKFNKKYKLIEKVRKYDKIKDKHDKFMELFVENKEKISEEFEFLENESIGDSLKKYSSYIGDGFIQDLKDHISSTENENEKKTYEDVLKKVQGNDGLKLLKETIKLVNYTKKEFSPIRKSDGSNYFGKAFPYGGSTKNDQLAKLFTEKLKKIKKIYLSEMKNKKFDGENSLKEIAKALFLGNTIPFSGVYGWNQSGHYMIFTDIRKYNPEVGEVKNTECLISDPENGVSEWIRGEDIIDGKFKAIVERVTDPRYDNDYKEGFNYSKILKYDMPTLATVFENETT